MRRCAGPVAAAWSSHRVTRLQSFGVAMREDRFAGRVSLRAMVITAYYSGVVAIRRLLPFLSASRPDVVAHSTIAVRCIGVARSLRPPLRCTLSPNRIAGSLRRTSRCPLRSGRDRRSGESRPPCPRCPQEKGSVPAAALSSFGPIRVHRGRKGGRKGILLCRILCLAQRGEHRLRTDSPVSFR